MSESNWTNQYSSHTDRRTSFSCSGFSVPALFISSNLGKLSTSIFTLFTAAPEMLVGGGAAASRLALGDRPIIGALGEAGGTEGDGAVMVGRCDMDC